MRITDGIRVVTVGVTVRVAVGVVVTVGVMVAVAVMVAVMVTVGVMVRVMVAVVVTVGVVVAAKTMTLPREKLYWVLRDLRRGGTLLAVSRENRVSISTVWAVAKRHGIPTRPVGRPVNDQPGKRQRRILDLLKRYGWYDARVARHVGVSREYVRQTRERWT